MGRRPKARGRDVHGIFLLNKDIGSSSNQAMQQVKRLFNANRAGHTGALDPLASGLLPICLGEASKLSGYLLAADKAYRARVMLGARTDSGDATGSIVQQKAIPDDYQQRLPQVLADFVGQQMQTPPMYSALKHRGQPLYQLARQGATVERAPRAIRIDKINIEQYGVDFFDIDVHCSKGTYIRTLAEDIGTALGSVAHLGKLQRHFAAPFSLAQNCYSLREVCQALGVRWQDLLEGTLAPDAIDYAKLDKLLLPVTSALNWQRIEIDHATAYRLQNGALIPDMDYEDGQYLVLYQQQLLCLGKIGGQVLSCQRLLHMVAPLAAP